LPDPTTPNLGLDLPIVGGDSDTWGGSLNGNFEILDALGSAQVVNVNANYTAVANPFPITILRVTTGASNIQINLPAPATIPGKIFVVKKVDSGAGSVNIIGAIDGQSSYVRANQFSFVWLYCNGGSFDVIANS
jgi:hypothetical protein